MWYNLKKMLMIMEIREWTLAAGVYSSEFLAPLSQCMEGWAIGCDWENDGETNPLWELANQPLMSVPVMDHTVGYLVYHAVLKGTSSNRSICLVPPSLFGAMKQIEGAVSSGDMAGMSNKSPEVLTRRLHQRSMVWTRPEPPNRIILPVIDHQQAHCYLWYGDIKPRQGRSAFHCELKYLDSLARPSSHLLTERFSLAQSIIKTLLPQINGEITHKYEFIQGYRQAPGSVDCGYFVCQAVSALAFFRDDALKQLQLVPHVRANIKRILESCSDKALLRLSRGLIAKKPILLHRQHVIAPPPWKARKDATPATPPTRKERPSWKTPEYTRSLSEPRESHRSLGLGLWAPMSWGEMFGPMPPPNFQLIDPNSAAPYLNRLEDRSFSMPSGILAGMSSASPEHFLESLLLRTGDISNVRWLPGLTIVGGKDDEEELERPEDCLGVKSMCDVLSFLKEDEERSVAILTGTNAGKPLRLNWVKDSLDLDQDWLSASLDVDSLSLTASDPEFTMPAVLHAYPPRASTLTNDNGLKVDVDNVATPLSHSKLVDTFRDIFVFDLIASVPNFTFLTIGQNNQFRVNLFFPHCKKGQDGGGHYITIMSEEDYLVWYQQVILPALQLVTWRCPAELKDTCCRLVTELPKSYRAAAAHCVTGTRTFTGHKVIPQILNLILRCAREIVNDTPSLGTFRGFFYHICGINLKAVCEVIPGRSDGNPMLHVLQQYPIVNWSAQNYCDIVVDVGLEINICREKLPLNVDDVTLIWKLDGLRNIFASSWRMPTTNAYVHSHVVGGVSSKPRAHVAPWFIRLHAYMKDKTNTYIHRDNSIGTGFAPDHGILGTAQYETQVTRLQNVWTDGRGSYGGRVEWRVGLRTANDMLRWDPNLWVQRFLSAGAIVSILKSSHVSSAFPLSLTG